MTSTAAFERSAPDAPPRSAVLFNRAFDRGLLLLLTASSFVASIEPSPYEFVFAAVLASLVATRGLRFHPAILPLALCLILFSIGGFVSLAPFLDENESVMFTGISAYLSVTALFFAMLLRIDAQGRLDALRRGYVIAAVAASIAGIVGFFHIGGFGEILTRYDRAAGTFKDPNVLGTFVILPLVYLVHSMLVERLRLWSVIAVAIIMFGGVFLSFSRGAWGHAFGSLALMTVLTYIASRDGRIRRRIIVLTVIGVISIAAALTAVLSVNTVGRTFEDRASFEQSYDRGEQGRFGNQLAAIPMLMERPNGFGPLRFRFFFVEDAHNVYINAFASYGWLGGFSYLVLIILTASIGWRLVSTNFGLRGDAIVIWSCLFVEILQGLQIDTDHWRHFWLMLGLIWGMLPMLRAPSRSLAPVRRLP